MCWGRWQRLLSGLDSDTRLYFYMLRRPSVPEAAGDEGSGIVAVSQRKRSAFLSSRVQQLEAYLVWSHNPRLRTVADGPASGRASRLTQWWQRRRASAPTYLGSEIEAAAARFRVTVDAGRALVEEHTPVDILSPAEASRLLSELINRPGTVWDGATGSGMNWRLALSELEAERSHLRLDGEPVILYSLLSPPGQAYANLLRDLYCLDAAMTVSLEWRPWAMEAARRRIRGAQRHYFARRYSMMAHVQETEGTAAAMVDSAAATESDRLGEALVELEADGVSYGEATLTVALHGELGRIERLDGDLRRLFAAHDAKVIREGYTASFRRGSRGSRPSLAGGRCGRCSCRPAWRPVWRRCSGRPGGRPRAVTSGARRSRSWRPRGGRRTTTICSPATWGTR